MTDHKDASVLHGHLLVLTTWPDAAGAQALARTLLERRLAACINILPPMTSLYTWDGRAQAGTEHQLLIKTTAARYADLQNAILAAHPYAVAEIIAVPIVRGLPAYLHWIDESTS
ncbi:divalent-cation tolerance protein CutA [Acidihalobacter ferrooxydans]|uniref:Divalent-cation tolerance protein CutA n=1 Tax=Acidihalobacter ferrooxydans TaxID=1765967 RepID=A0A1P8UE88_9GAMM|nr:divalent-cation tolerance protein CutA [Acidihalobacter ferrooxydans]APZ42126.1 divalent-cation tolerance protein CutA [Acidihalobacter ferrooxydans]